jgi:flagellar biosynthetic protein FliR
MSVTFAPGILVAFLLALVRASAWVAVAPPFNTKLIPAQVKIGLSAVLAMAVAPQLATHIPPDGSLSTPDLIGAVFLQVGAGLILGFIATLLLSAVQAAGSLIDLFGGFTISQAMDPFSNAQSSVFGRIYQLLGTTLLFAINGHLLLVRGFMASFDAVGITGFNMQNVSDLLIHDFLKFFVAAVEIAGPLLAALFLAEVVLGLLSRAAPQLNVFALGFPLKILITLLMASVAIPLLPDAVNNLVNEILRAGHLAIR